MRQLNKENRGKRYLFSVLFFLAAAAVLSFAGVTAARYVRQEKKSGVAEAQAFFVSSDLLKEQTSDNMDFPSYYIDPETVSFSIKLYNWADPERVTNTDIKYIVRSDESADITDGGNGTLKGTADGIQYEAVLTVTPKQAASAKKNITVAVQTTEPYSRTLGAVFTLAKGNQYRIEDAAGNRAAVLVMACTDSEKDITISMGGTLGIVPDATDNRLTESGGEYKFHSPGQGIYSLLLLKTDAGLDLSQANTEFADAIQIREHVNTAP